MHKEPIMSTPESRLLGSGGDAHLSEISRGGVRKDTAAKKMIMAQV